MERSNLLEVLKEIVYDTIAKSNRVQAEELESMRKHLSSDLNPSTPLATLGWDSLQMTWLLVRLEERFNIDTSSLSLFDLFTVGDLLDELQTLITNRG